MGTASTKKFIKHNAGVLTEEAALTTSAVSYTHLRANEPTAPLVYRPLLANTTCKT